jgi:hypothetical protein
MSKRIECTLTDRQWFLLSTAVCQYELALEDDIGYGSEPPQTMGAFHRMSNKIWHGDPS